VEGYTVIKKRRTWKKADRLNAVLEHLRTKPRTIKELLERLELNGSPKAQILNHRTLLRDIEDLETRGHTIKKSKARQPVYTLVASPAPALSPAEGMAVLIGLRLLTHHTHLPPRSYRHAFEKILLTLPSEMRTMVEHSFNHKESDEARFDAFEHVASCWHQKRVLKFDYLALNTTSGQRRSVELEPYGVEISRSNFEIYVIGRRRNHPPFEVRTFMMRLMKHVTPLSDTYEIPEDFDPRQYLSNAWGVIGDRNPIIVRLKFDSSVTRWLERNFPGERAREFDAAGNLIMTICTGRNNDGKPVELLPWIRGWADKCQVLEPLELRQQWLEDARAVVGLGDL
jgi:predicted DNA-binding transcriptional regulator YafY